MKTLFISIALLTFSLTSCGGGNNDAKAFCDCVANQTPECEAEMEKLEEEFKKDKDRYEKFAKDAREMCPDAEKYIKRMN